MESGSSTTQPVGAGDDEEMWGCSCGRAELADDEQVRGWKSTTNRDSLTKSDEEDPLRLGLVLSPAAVG